MRSTLFASLLVFVHLDSSRGRCRPVCVSRTPSGGHLARTMNPVLLGLSADFQRAGPLCWQGMLRIEFGLGDRHALSLGAADSEIFVTTRRLESETGYCMWSPVAMGLSRSCILAEEGALCDPSCRVVGSRALADVIAANASEVIQQHFREVLQRMCCLPPFARPRTSATHRNCAAD